MTDTHPSHPVTSSDWRRYAAEIHAAVLAKEAARATGASADASDPLDALPDDGPATAPVLTARQAFLILGLAATLGSRAALAVELGRGAILALSGIRSDLMIELARLLPAALPEGFFIAKGDRDRLRPGAVTVVKGAQAGGWPNQEQLRLDLCAALAFPAPVILLLPDDIEAKEILGEAEAGILPFRPFEREIIAEVLAQTYPNTDAATIIQRLPPDAQLAETPMLWLMLALRCDSAEAAAALLTRRGWPERRRLETSAE